MSDARKLPAIVHNAPAGAPSLLLVAGVAAALLLLIWGLIGRQVAFEREAALDLAREQNDDRALMLQQFVSQTLDNADHAAIHFSGTPAGEGARQGEGERPRLLSDAIANDEDFASLEIFDATGTLAATTLREPGQRAEAIQAFNALPRPDTAGDALQVNKPRYAPSRRENLIWLSKHVPGTKVGGGDTILIAMEPSQLTEIFGKAAVKPSESAWVVGLDGTIRSRATGNRTTSGEDVRHGLLFQKQRATAVGSFTGPGTLDHRLRMVSHRHVPGYPLFVSYSILEDEVLREPRARARLFALGGALLSAATILLAWMLVRMIRDREARAAEAAAAKARLEEAQRIAEIGDWALDLRDNSVTWSPQLYAMYERDPALGALTEASPSMFSEASIEANRQARVRITEQGLPATWELEVSLPSGRNRIHRLSAVPTRDQTGTIIGFHGTTQDVTEIKRHEALQRELAHYARIGAMNSLAATLSHELTQPLAAASNYLSTGRFLAAGMTIEPGPMIVDQLTHAGMQIKRAGEIIQRMRRLVSGASGERAIVSVEEILDEAVATISALRICAGDVPCLLPEEPAYVLCDSVQIQQVVLNLVRNACEAQKGISQRPPKIEVTIEGEMIVIAVRDHGPGFPDPLLQKICQPFLTSKEDGMGLGLSISRTIVESHGGSLRAENAPSGGAIVSLALPRHEPD